MRRGFGGHAAFILVATAAFLWPAYWNGYPLVFGDSGVYLTDGVLRHVSWPRPFFYGLAMLPLHWELSAWPVAVAQAATAAALIRMTLLLFVSRAREAFHYMVALVLAGASSLPWFAAQIMPDVFGPLAVLASAAVTLRPERLRVWQQALLVALAAGFISFHQSFVPTMLACAVVLAGLRWRQAGRLRPADLARAASPPLLAILAVVAMNTVYEGRVSFSPYGNIFVLARLVIEGPAQRTLARECPRPGWTLCAFQGRFPDNVEAFQFGADGTVTLAGGFKVVSAQAGPIIADAIEAEPWTVLAGAARRAIEQFGRFASGDWLLKPHENASRGWARVFPPAEVARYQAARQQRGLWLLPDWLEIVHIGAGWFGMAGLVAGIASDWRRRPVLAAVLLTFAVALVVNAGISGALSGVYDRYQSRFIWLAVLGTLMWLGAAAARESET